MLESIFLNELRVRKCIRLTPDWFVFKKPISLYNYSTDEEAVFKNMDELYAYKIGDKTVKQIIDEASMDILVSTYNGGNGSSSSTATFKFSHASGSSKGAGKRDFPVRMNTRVRLDQKSPEAMLRAFRDLHVPDDHESAITVDRDGYVTQYVHGNAHSVAIGGRKGEMTIHNHPGGGAFSDADLISAASDRSVGIIASGKYGDYVFKKTGHFKAKEFIKAVKHATLRGKSYDDAADKWLKQHQKEFGYRYAFDKKKS